MKTIERIEKKGYKVTFSLSVNKVLATRNGKTIMEDNVTKLYNKIK